ncbi:MAG TPA: Rne/Rng family ribonuclease [Terriglobales bacterium]|jgi:Rne/Rng family ribonuclease|nr:Rne/Rng family ribonuclease [Terriglobales bacterium]
MNKELFVSSTPHETKVGVVEDDQLAEIYLERENEYTLAGSIYKGKVTRVLPGMQSAFVDIGLERDAFLYVSDFMDLEQQDDDLDEVIPTGRTVEQKSGSRTNGAPVEEDQSESLIASDTQTEPEQGSAQPSQNEQSPREYRGSWRGRGGRRRGRGRSFDSRRPRSSEVATADNSTRSDDFTPPPDYEPILLPGESISKYRRRAEAQVPEQNKTERSAVFADDEPLFATQSSEPLRELHGDVPVTAEIEEQFEETSSWEGDDERESIPEILKAEPAVDEQLAEESEEQEIADEAAQPFVEEPLTSIDPGPPIAAVGTLEEEEIDEEEADIASYVEELEEDATFEELEEETRAAEEHREQLSQIAASEDSGSETPASTAEPPLESATESEDDDSEEIELEEAQAEAEALVAAESGDGEVRAELRAPAETAGYTQRAQRSAPAFDRRRGRRGGRRFRRRENTVVPQISDLLKEGQEVLIQIAKEPIGKKGARITSHIALPGRFLVYMPTVNHTGVSRKISSDEERLRLKRIIMSERENGQGGFIVRTAAAGASEEELRADIRFLKNLWAEIKTRSENSNSPALIYHDLNVVERVLRDQVTSDFSAIWVDTEQEYERILRFANRFQPGLVRRVKLYTKETPLYDQFGLSEEINKALKSKVWLKSGGYIVINQTEALVAIDVNTGKYVGKTARLEDTIVKTNVDAIKEIVRQIRLRDLGGIIVIDFIDMDERRNRQKVMQALEEALRADRAPSKVLQFNDFGLVAITRKRVKQSLERTIGSPCPYCQSTGYVKAVNTICNEIYVEMRKMAKHLEHQDVMLRVHPDVAKALKTSNGKWLNEMEELTKRTIIVKSDPAVHQEQFDIN